MKLKQPRCQYSAEFKLEAVQQVILHQQRVVDVARSLGMDISTRGKWVHQYKAEKRGVTPVGGCRIMPDTERITQCLL
ncbi:hypothetical protein XBO1_2570013 [Xenorhabdus bovienii str. oregonense]|uniref:Transposase n=1 Tax=Xenorhabdus bovienii str. oregonense TaxID=1398202 RepID=A0A077PC03_XENBV|nr:transposase [Xenorhabdus bovienii]CDH07196.1 hypothetical protein XBO1_2570013 [Xenorhabdus bovienii str. oregonense]